MIVLLVLSGGTTKMVLTLDTLQNSMIIMFVSYGFAFVLSIYQLYLNWKQARVNNQMKDLVNETKAIRILLEKRYK